MDVVGEESFVVEEMAEALRAGGRAHGLAVLVAVHLHDGVEPLGEGAAVGAETDDGKDDACVLAVGRVAAETVEFRAVAGVDAVAGCHAGVASEDGEVGAADAEGRAAVVGVAEFQLVEMLGNAI